MAQRTLRVVPEAHRLELLGEQLLLPGLDLGQQVIALDAEVSQGSRSAPQGAAAGGCQALGTRWV